MKRALPVLVLACAVATAAAAGSRTLAPVRFQKAPGWYAGAGRVHACVGVSRSRCTQVASWAGTVRRRDCGDCEPPHKTLESLPAGGIVIGVLLGKEQRLPRNVMPWPPRLRAGAVVSPIEGAPARIGFFGQGGRLRGFSAQLFVYFGRRHPTARQLARAQAELNSAKLP
jgi:hypothetical protein